MATLVRLGASMSLINQVLQDLDRRQASAAGVPTSVRSLGAGTLASMQPRWPSVAGAFLALAALSAVVVAWSGQTRDFAASVTTAAPAHAVVAASAPAIAAVRSAAVDASSRAMPIDAERDRLPIQSPSPLPLRSDDSQPLGAGTNQDARGNENARSIAVAAPDGRVAPVVAGGAIGTRTTDSAATPAQALPAPQAQPSPAAIATGPEGAGRAAVVGPTASVEVRPHPLSAAERAEADYQRGLGLHQRGQDAAAEAAFAAALQDDRAHVAARQALAITWIGRRRLDDAQRLIADGLEIDAQQLALTVLLARVKAEQGDPNGAIDTLKAALAAPTSVRRGEPADARALLATLQQRAGRNAEAIDNYAAALRLVPGNATWWVGLAISLSAEGRTEAARQAFERARATEMLSPELAQYVEQRLRAMPAR